MKTLIRDATVLTVNGQSQVLDKGSVFVEGETILAVGETEQVLAQCPAPDKTIDGRGKIVAPGFISTHNHLGYTFFRGLSEEVGLRAVTGMYFPMGTVATRQEREAVGSLTCAELLKSGVTTIVEMEEDADVFADFIEKIGIRAEIGVMIHDADVDLMARGTFRFDAGLRDAQLRQAIELAEQWHGKANGRIRAMMTPNMTISSSPELLRACRSEADRRGLRLSMHLGWGPEEVGIIEDLHDVTPFEYARDHGLMAEDTIMAHCLYTNEADQAVLAHSRTCIAHCPLMNATRGHIAPVQTYLANGNTVGLGIDNMFSDHFDVVRSALLMARLKADDPLAMMAPDALYLATMGGARSIGLEKEIGSIEPGKRADLMILNARTFGLVPLLDPVASLVYHAHSKDVETVLVNGEIVVDSGQVQRFDADALIADADSASQEAWARFEHKYGGRVAPRS